MQAYKILHRLGTVEMYHSVRIFSPVVGTDRVKFLKHQILTPQKATPETVWWVTLKEKTRNTSYIFKPNFWLYLQYSENEGALFFNPSVTSLRAYTEDIENYRIISIADSGILSQQLNLSFTMGRSQRFSFVFASVKSVSCSILSDSL